MIYIFHRGQQRNQRLNTVRGGKGEDTGGKESTGLNKTNGSTKPNDIEIKPLPSWVSRTKKCIMEQ